MTEATVTSDLHSYLKPLNKGPVIKLADKATVGIPDTVVTGQPDVWLEIKLEKVRKWESFNLNSILKHGGPQSRLMAQLSFHSYAFYAVFFNNQLTREWKTLILSGQQAWSWSPAASINSSFDFPGITAIKDFERVWEIIKNIRGRYESKSPAVFETGV